MGRVVSTTRPKSLIECRFLSPDVTAAFFWGPIRGKTCTMFRTFLLLPVIGVALLASLVFSATAVQAQAVTPFRLDLDKALERAQGAIGQTVPDFTFRDTRGREVRLSDFRDGPVVVTFIYTSCASSCPTITTHLIDAIAAAEEALGPGTFKVVSIGYDAPVDKPEAMAAFRERYAIDTPHWKFLSGDLIAVTELADVLGYTFVPATDNEGFEHLSHVTVIDKKGTVYRQVYGENFPLTHFVEPLKEAAFGTKAPFRSLDDLIKKVQLFCITYDPKAGVYRFDYTPFVQIGAGFSVIIFLAVFVVRNTLRLRRRDRERAVKKT